MDSDEHRARHRLTPGAVGVAVVLAAAGLLFAVSAETAGGAQLRVDGPDLPALIRAQEAQVAASARELAALRDDVDAATARVSARDGAVAGLQDEAAPLAMMGGLEPVRGPGLVVTLNDAPRNVTRPVEAKPDDLVVHQQDVQAVVNALWAGGAEAMMLQDQRVISTSAVRCVGNTLILQGRVYSPPYVITAVGDVPGMEQAMDASPAITIYQEYVDVFGLGWQVDRPGEITLPAYSGSLALQHAAVPTPPSDTEPDDQSNPPEADQ